MRCNNKKPPDGVAGESGPRVELGSGKKRRRNLWPRVVVVVAARIRVQSSSSPSVVGRGKTNILIKSAKVIKKIPE